MVKQKIRYILIKISLFDKQGNKYYKPFKVKDIIEKNISKNFGEYGVCIFFRGNTFISILEKEKDIYVIKTYLENMKMLKDICSVSTEIEIENLSLECHLKILCISGSYSKWKQKLISMKKEKIKELELNNK